MPPRLMNDFESGQRLVHDSRGLSLDDFRAISGGSWGRHPVGYGRDQRENVKKGVFTQAHRVAARYAMHHSRLIHTGEGSTLVPRDVVEEVGSLLARGERLPVFSAGPAIKDALYEVLDSTEPATEGEAPQD